MNLPKNKIKAIYAIAKSKNIDLESYKEHFKVEDINQLTMADASQLIKDLNAAPNFS